MRAVLQVAFDGLSLLLCDPAGGVPRQHRLDLPTSDTVAALDAMTRGDQSGKDCQ